MNDFWKENNLDGSQGHLKALGHPKRPRQAQPWGVKQVPFIYIFKDKSIKNCPKVISNLDKLNKGDYSKYQLCS